MSALRVNISFSGSKLPTASSKDKNKALVLGFASDGKKGVPVKDVKAVKDFADLYKFVSDELAFEGKYGQNSVLLHQTQLLSGSGHKHLVVSGVGSPKDTTAQKLLALGGKLVGELNKAKIDDADIWVDSFFQNAASATAEDAPKDFAGRPLKNGLLSVADAFENLALGTILGAYRFDTYKSTKKESKKAPTLRFVSSHLDEKKAQVILKKVQALAEAIYIARDMGNTPGSDMYPELIAREAQKAGKQAGFAVTVWNEKKLKEKGMNGILAVGQGSVNPPRLVIMEHKAKTKKAAKTLVLVGKGISFDTGGICLKPAAGMEDMKLDMGGAASVVAAMYAIAKLALPVNVVGLVATAENMNSGNAVKPGDIYKAYDGQTVEVINTDAEGRLVLADALVFAKEYKPTCVIDIATLTGAVLIALGDTATGVMGNNAHYLEAYKAAAEKSGEKSWELPMYEEYFEDMKSKIADLKNIGGSRNAGSAKAAVFLNAFVKNDYPWIHLDIAGTGMSGKTQGAHCPADSGTGVPTRSLVEFAASLAD